MQWGNFLEGMGSILLHLDTIVPDAIVSVTKQDLGGYTDIVLRRIILALHA